jgi:hypothetical protein
MSRIDKLEQRLQAKPKDFTWDELVRILTHHGFDEIQTGKTAGSRRAFVNLSTEQIIRLHKPHPGNILKAYQIKDVLDMLGLD